MWLRERFWNRAFKGDIFRLQAFLLRKCLEPVTGLGEASMRYLTRVAMFFALLLGAGSLALSAARAQGPQDTGTISGRVTLDGKPIQGVIVMASRDTHPARRGQDPSTSSRATTDSDGRYRLEGVPPGTYTVAPSAPALTSADAAKLEKEVAVTGDATIDRIDFSLARGGVITGRITDADGNPIVAAFVTLKPVDNSNSTSVYNMLQSVRMFFTDDRGVYRLFGLPAGRYLVGAGRVDNSSFGQLLNGQNRVNTYYPGVTEEPMAKPVAVAPGTEAVDIDIKLGVSAKGFLVSGRVIESDTRKPVANTMVNFETIARSGVSGKDEDEEDDERLGKMSGVTMTNVRGEFRLESVGPGSFQATASWLAPTDGANQYYTDPVKFEVRSSNIENLEIAVYRGASINGMIVVDDVEHTEIREQVAQLSVHAFVVDGQTKSRSESSGTVSADGSFRISGLRAGKAKISTYSNGPERVSLLRIERNGVDQQDGLLVRPNEQITGVRLVMTEANCVIRGHVILQGSLTPSSGTFVLAQAVSGPRSFSRWTNRIDSKNDFVIENLPPGSYEVWASTSVVSSGKVKTSESAKQTVSVARAIPAEVTLLLDVTATERDK
jgi:protocatechuate 3,4-dioxygenase beta subunit